MSIKRLGVNGTWLVELTPHQFGIKGQHAVGERVYGPYRSDLEVVNALLEIEKTIPAGKTMHIFSTGKGGQWEITGEKAARKEPLEEGSIGMIN